MLKVAQGAEESSLHLCTFANNFKTTLKSNWDESPPQLDFTLLYLKEILLFILRYKKTRSRSALAKGPLLIFIHGCENLKEQGPLKRSHEKVFRKENTNKSSDDNNYKTSPGFTESS